MASCPKCSHHLKLTDWRQKCPYCGANIVLYDQQERLMQDADKAEVQYYHFQKKIDRMKASFAGSKLTVARIILSVLPLLPAVLCPLMNVSFSGPFFAESKAINGIELYNYISGMDFDALFACLGSSIVGKPFLLMAISAVSFVLSLVLLLLSLIFLIMACGKHGNSRNITMNSLTILFALVSTVTAAMFPKAMSAVFPVFESKFSVGLPIYVVTLIALLVINIIIAKVGVPVHHKQCYVGGIPIEEYFEMQENGWTLEQIREEQYARLQALQDEQEAKLAAAEAEAKEKEKKEEKVDG